MGCGQSLPASVQDEIKEIERFAENKPNQMKSKLEELLTDNNTNNIQHIEESIL